MNWTQQPTYHLQALVSYESYKELYTLEREEVLVEFQNSNPHLSEFEAEMERYERLEHEIIQLPSQQSLTAAIRLSNGMQIVCVSCVFERCCVVW